jgi:hypothetical protein
MRICTKSPNAPRDNIRAAPQKNATLAKIGQAATGQDLAGLSIGVRASYKDNRTIVVIRIARLGLTPSSALANCITSTTFTQ